MDRTAQVSTGHSTTDGLADRWQPLRKSSALRRRVKKYKTLYLFILPAVLWYVVFEYIPIYGITLSIRDFHFQQLLFSPIADPWYKYFRDFFNYFLFWEIIKNTLVVSVGTLIIGFPAPIILALLLNEVKNVKFKRTIQTVSYLPHFVSWVIVVALMQALFSPYDGIINHLRGLVGMDPVFYMGEREFFYPLLFGSRVWKSVGWGAIIYLAALSSVNVELYDAATIDGAGRFKQMQYVSLPAIKPTIAILLILNMGNLLNAGFDQIFLMKHPANSELAMVLDIYIIEKGLQGAQFSYATAVGVFKGVVGLVLILVTNWVVKRLTETGLF